MFRFEARTPFLRAIEVYLAHDEQRPFSEQKRASLQAAADILIAVEADARLAFLDEAPADVILTQLSDELLSARLYKFMDATCMILDGHTAQLFTVVVDEQFEDDFLTARAWGAFLAGWMNLRHPRPARPWHYMDFYISNHCSEVIASYDRYASAFVRAIEFKNKRSSSTAQAE